MIEKQDSIQEVKMELSEFLEEGEILIWAGKPKEGVILDKSDWYEILISLVWLTLSVIWCWIAISSKAPLNFILLIIPFILIGVFYTFT